MVENSTLLADCGPPETMSRSLMESITAIHNFEVANFSLLDGMGLGKYASSSIFSVASYDWAVRFYPDGTRPEDAAAYASAFLYFHNGVAGVRTRFSLSLLEKDGNISQLAHFSGAHTFASVGSDWGFYRFVEKLKLKTSSCLDNDCFTIRCELTIIKEPRAEDIKANSITVPQSNLHQHFECMLKVGKGADVKFYVGGQTFHAHRCVVAARSPVFDAELFGPMKEKVEQCIKIEDMEPSIFEALLHFIYTDSLPDSGVLGNTMAMQHLLVAADRYGLDRLRLMCEQKLCEGIDVGTVATTLALAEQHHCQQLRDVCIGFMVSSKGLSAIMETDGFNHLMETCPSVLKVILDKMSRERDRKSVV